MSEVKKQLDKIKSLLDDKKGWNSPAEPFTERVKQILEELEVLKKLQEGAFRVVDHDLDFTIKAQRLVNWLRTHPSFSAVEGLELVDNLGVGNGSRGVRTTKFIETSEEVIRVPVDCCLSIDTAYASRDFGAYLDNRNVATSFRSTSASTELAIYLLVENYKGFKTPLKDQVDPKDIPIPASDNSKFWRPKSQLGGKGKGKFPELGHPSFIVEKAVPITPESDHPWGTPWRAYISLLPSKVDNFFSWTADDFKRLSSVNPGAFECSKFLADAIRTYALFWDAFVENKALGAGFAEYFSWEAYIWAVSTVMARNNHIPRDENSPIPDLPTPVKEHMKKLDKVPGLIPYIDMFNHIDGPITLHAGTVSIDDQAPVGVTVLQAVQNFQPGEEVRMSYGNRPHKIFLRYQGFVPTDFETITPADIVNLEVSVLDAKKDPTFPIKVRNLLPQAGVQFQRQGIAHLIAYCERTKTPPFAADPNELWQVPFYFDLFHDGAITSDLLSLCRLAVIEKDELKDALEVIVKERKEEKQKRQLEENAGISYDFTYEGVGSSSQGEVDDANLIVDIPKISDKAEKNAYALIIAQLKANRNRMVAALLKTETATDSAPVPDINEFASKGDFVGVYIHHAISVVDKAITTLEGYLDKGEIMPVISGIDHGGHGHSHGGHGHSHGGHGHSHGGVPCHGH